MAGLLIFVAVAGGVFLPLTLSAYDTLGSVRFWGGGGQLNGEFFAKVSNSFGFNFFIFDELWVSGATFIICGMFSATVSTLCRVAFTFGAVISFVVPGTF